MRVSQRGVKQLRCRAGTWWRGPPAGGDRRVDDDAADTEPHGQHLDHCAAVQHEGQEHAGDDQRGSADHAGRGREPASDAGVVVMRASAGSIGPNARSPRACQRELTRQHALA